MLFVVSWCLRLFSGGAGAGAGAGFSIGVGVGGGREGNGDHTRDNFQRSHWTRDNSKLSSDARNVKRGNLDKISFVRVA